MLSSEQARKIRKSLDTEEKKLPLVFNALSDSSRYGIFNVLLENRNLCVTDIAEIFRISVPAASQQLKILEMNGLVIRERRGQMICYCVKKNDPVVKSIMRLIAGVRPVASTANSTKF